MAHIAMLSTIFDGNMDPHQGTVVNHKYLNKRKGQLKILVTISSLKYQFLCRRIVNVEYKDYTIEFVHCISVIRVV